MDELNTETSAAVASGSNPADVAARASARARALRLEHLTVGYNIVEGIIAVIAATAAGSVALLGFGVDSFIESLSGAILIWRLRAESGSSTSAAIHALDRKAERWVGVSFFVLAAYIAWEAATSLVEGRRPEITWIGIGLTVVSIAIMWWLGAAKRRSARELGSRALEADAFQTTVCWWLSLITLSGVGLNAAFGWWWADPVAALGMCALLLIEGRKAWNGQPCGSCP
ncbi:MAG: cation diffusion facilitator family transporter [Planctomycetota bacterium]